jgi:hypothetical protein
LAKKLKDFSKLIIQIKLIINETRFFCQHSSKSNCDSVGQKTKNGHNLFKVKIQNLINIYHIDKLKIGKKLKDFSENGGFLEHFASKLKKLIIVL